MSTYNYKSLGFRKFPLDLAEKRWKEREVEKIKDFLNLDSMEGNEGYKKYREDLESYSYDGTRPALDLNYKKSLIQELPVAAVYTIDLNVDSNFILQCNGAFSLVATFDTSHIGKSGTIVFNNVGVTIPALLPANMLTPNGSDLAWVTALGAKSVISYLIVDANSMLCNYIGNFS